MSEKVLEVEDLEIKFLKGKKSEGLTAVDKVDFSVEKGKVLGIVGESGCGKSVTSLSIMGLLDEKKSDIGGRILFKGRDLLSLSNKEMEKIRGNSIAMIFQEPMTALNPVFSIGFQLGEVLHLHKGIKSKSERDAFSMEMLHNVGIPFPGKIMKQYPHQLSGGMRQRVMIAMSLLCSPELLIADEPTTALDVTIQAQVLELLNQIKEKFQMGIIFITHDLGVIAEMADDVMVMYGGQIVEKAPVNELFDYPVHPYTKGLMASRPALFSKGESLCCIEGMVPSLGNFPEGCPFAPRCAYAGEKCNICPGLREIYKDHYVRCFYTGGGESNAR